MILKVKDTVINKIDKNVCLHSLYTLEWATDNIQINKEKKQSIIWSWGQPHTKNLLVTSFWT